jgi:hypothetical protein
MLTAHPQKGRTRLKIWPLDAHSSFTEGSYTTKNIASSFICCCISSGDAIDLSSTPTIVEFDDDAVNDGSSDNGAVDHNKEAVDVRMSDAVTTKDDNDKNPPDAVLNDPQASKSNVHKTSQSADPQTQQPLAHQVSDFFNFCQLSGFT